MSFRWERWVLVGVMGLGLSLAFVTVLQLVLTNLVPVAASTASPKFVPTATLTPFDPAYYGLPDVIAGYKVLAVENSGNIACMPDGTMQLILQSSQPNLDAFLKNNPGGNVDDELKKLNIKQPDHWTFQYVGPGITRASVIYLAKDWHPNNTMLCHILGRPILTDEPILTLQPNNTSEPKG